MVDINTYEWEKVPVVCRDRVDSCGYSFFYAIIKNESKVKIILFMEVHYN